MSGLFSKPKTPKPITPPTIDDAATAARTADARRRRPGRVSRTSTFFGGGVGDEGGGSRLSRFLGQ